MRATTSGKLSSTTTFYASLPTPPYQTTSISPNEESFRASSIISEALSLWSECELEGRCIFDALDFEDIAA